MHKGKVLFTGSLPEIRTLVDRTTLFRLKMDHESKDILKKLGITPVSSIHNNGYAEYDIRIKEQDIPSLLAQLNKNGAKIYTCAPKDMNLDQVFEKLITGTEN